MDAEKMRYTATPFVITLAGVLALEFIAGPAVPVDDPLVATGVIRALQAAFIVAAALLFGGDARIAGLRLQALARGIKRGLIWSAVFGAIAAIAGIAIMLSGYEPLGMIRVGLPYDKQAIVALFLVGGLVGPLAEELFFRGAVYGFFRRSGVIAAVLGSSALFILAHSAGGIAPTHVVGAFVFAAAYEYEKNIMVPVTIHVLGNVALFSLAFLMAS